MLDYTSRLERMEDKLDKMNNTTMTTSQKLEDFIQNFDKHVLNNDALQKTCDQRMRSLEKFKYKWMGMAGIVGVVVALAPYAIPVIIRIASAL